MDAFKACGTTGDGGRRSRLPAFGTPGSGSISIPDSTSLGLAYSGSRPLPPRVANAQIPPFQVRSAHRTWTFHQTIPESSGPLEPPVRPFAETAEVVSWSPMNLLHSLEVLEVSTIPFERVCCRSASMADPQCCRPSVARSALASPVADRCLLATSSPCHLHSAFCGDCLSGWALAEVKDLGAWRTGPQLACCAVEEFSFVMHSEIFLVIDHLVASLLDGFRWCLKAHRSTSNWLTRQYLQLTHSWDLILWRNVQEQFL